MLCGKYGLDPLADGVVISHREGCARGIASNHGDPEHLWAQLGMGYTMDGFRRAVRAAMAGGPSGTDGYTRIMGRAEATAEQMEAYLKAKNPEAAQSVFDMIPLYLSEGEAEGVRGDIAFAQSCLETGNFEFFGSAVTLAQNNFCGMGVTGKGVKGNSFDTPQFGIRAQVQHLKAYASKENPDGRGWAAGAGYGEKILVILKGILGMTGGDVFRPYLVWVSIPDLNIRKEPGTDKEKTGKYTGTGIFTIVEEADGKGASKWGKLKSGAGWISLDFCERV